MVELKTVEFEPEFAGKLSFCLSAVDGELKSEQDNPDHWTSFVQRKRLHGCGVCPSGREQADGDQ